MIEQTAIEINWMEFERQFVTPASRISSKQEDKKMEKRDKLLPVSIVADRLAVSVQSIYNLIVAGDIPAIRVGAKAGIRIYKSDLESFLERRTADYEEPAPE